MQKAAQTKVEPAAAAAASAGQQSADNMGKSGLAKTQMRGRGVNRFDAIKNESTQLIGGGDCAPQKSGDGVQKPANNPNAQAQNGASQSVRTNSNLWPAQSGGGGNVWPTTSGGGNVGPAATSDGWPQERKDAPKFAKKPTSAFFYVFLFF